MLPRAPLPTWSGGRGRCGRDPPHEPPNSISTASFVDHLAGAEAQDVDAEHPVGCGIGEDFDESVRLQHRPGATIGGEGELADPVVDASAFSSSSVLPTEAISGWV